MAFDFDPIHVKGNTILHVDTLCRLEFGNEKIENHENAEDKILLWVEMDVLLLNRLRIETRQELVLSKMLERIKRNV